MSKLIGKFKSYPIYISDKPEKKYYALVNGKKKYFGSATHEQYRDRFGYYSDLDHNDKTRRKNFKKRFQQYRNKVGSSAWFSDKILW